MGLRTGELSNVKTKLRDIGKITPNNSFRNDKEENLRTRIEDSEALLKNIDELILEMKKEDLDKLEIENVQLSNEKETVEQQTKLLEDASKRETYERGHTALSKLKEGLQNLKQVDVFNQNDEQVWKYAQRDIENYTKEKAELLKELETNQKSLANKNEDLKNAKLHFDKLKVTNQKLNEEIKPKISDYQARRKIVIQQDAKSKFFTWLSSFSAVFLLTTLLGIVLTSSLFFYAFAIIAVLLMATSLVTKLKFMSNKAQLFGLFDKIKLATSQFNLSGEKIEEILPRIQMFDEEYEAKSSELITLAMLNQNLDGKINELQSKTIPAMDKKIGDLNAQIVAIKEKSGTTSLEKYTESLNKKMEFEKTVSDQNAALDSLFETSLEKMEEKVAFWANEISDLEEYRDRAKDIKYSGKTENKLKNRQSEIKARQKEINQKLENCKEKMKTVEREASKVLRTGDCVSCETNAGMAAIRNAIADFVESNENNKTNVLEALKIFEEIENEEKNKVSTLFGDDSKVSEYFKEITNGFYKAVRLNTEAKNIQVERNDGETFDAEKLSAGTYDQLYLSIRLALGEKLLKGDKAFFIMDDPFIKADGKRLRSQMNILRRISQSGWQILYFSAKDEVREALKELISNGSVNLVETHAVAK